jgi:DNA invertase Pin-like site-specific DNA recombinase
MRRAMAKRKPLIDTQARLDGLRCAAYLRCSKDDQAAGEYSTIDAQRDFLTRRITEAGGQLVAVIHDEDKTGTNLNRPGWRELLALAEKRAIDAVMVTYMNRLGRGDEFVIARYELGKHGVQVALACERFEEDAAGELHRHMTNALDGTYAIQIATWTRNKLCRMVEAGIWPGGPFHPVGYLLEPLAALPSFVLSPSPRKGVSRSNPKRLVIDPQTADLARDAFDLFLRSDSIVDVADMLTGATGERWTDKRARKMLSSPLYVGRMEWGGIVNDRFCEPLIPRAIWEKAQAQLKAREGKRGKRERSVKRPPLDGYAYLFAGRISCGCGGSMTPYWAENRAGLRYHYYQCNRSRREGCRVGQVNADRLHDATVGELARMLSTPWRMRQSLARVATTFADATPIESACRAARRRERAAADRIAKLTDALASAPPSVMAIVLGRIEEEERLRVAAAAEVSQLERDLVSARASKPTARGLETLLSRFFEAWGLASDEEKIRLLQLLVPRVEILDKTRVRIDLIGDFGVVGPASEAGPVGSSENNSRYAPVGAGTLTWSLDLPLERGRNGALGKD